MLRNKKIYPIGKVSSLCNVSVKTLRYYDEIGLLVPDCRKDDSNYRYYTHEQILTLFIIRKLRHLGVPLKEIKTIICQKDAQSMEHCIRQRLEEISHAMEALNDQYAEGQLLLERLEKGQNLLEAEQPGWTTEGIRVEDIPISPVLFTRRIKKNYKNSDVSVDRWFELFEMVARLKRKAVGSVILTYHNPPLEQFYQNDCDLEISIPVNELSDSPAAKNFGGFPAVTALHIGKNEDIIQTHIKAIKWLNQQGYTITGPISEEYIISPIDTTREQDHITKVIIPIEKPKK
ncbi:MAG: MerR family transcriptional regulator [Anaerotignum sp.]|nr:MerR family transcriptional regulator [Anaerotignum sp.]